MQNDDFDTLMNQLEANHEMILDADFKARLKDAISTPKHLFRMANLNIQVCTDLINYIKECRVKIDL